MCSSDLISPLSLTRCEGVYVSANARAQLLGNGGIGRCLVREIPTARSLVGERMGETHKVGERERV